MLNLYLEHSGNCNPELQNQFSEENITPQKENKTNSPSILKSFYQEFVFKCFPILIELFPFEIYVEEYTSYLIKTSFMKSLEKHIPLLPICCSKIIYIFALPDDYHYEDLFKRAEKFWMDIKSIRIIKEKEMEAGKYSLILYFNEQNKAEDFFHVFFLLFSS